MKIIILIVMDDTDFTIKDMRHYDEMGFKMSDL